MINKEAGEKMTEALTIIESPIGPVMPVDEVAKKGDGWKTILKELNTETPEEIELLTAMAGTFSNLVPGAWSVDFAKTTYDTPRAWILIDAAEAFRSWHPSDCPVAFGGV